MTATSFLDVLRGRERFRISIVVALLVGFGTVTAIAALAFTLTVFGATDTTGRLLLERNRALVDGEVRRITEHLDAVKDRLQLLAALTRSGRLDSRAPLAMQDALAVTFEGLGYVSAAAFTGNDEIVFRVYRSGDRVIRDSRPLSDTPGSVERFHKLRDAQSIFWGELFRASDGGQPMVNVRIPLRDRDGNFLGGLIATVTLGDLSRTIVDPQTSEDANFILVGRDRVVAHRNLIGLPMSGTAGDGELPTLAEVGDKVLASIWSRPVVNRRLQGALKGIGHVVEVDGRDWVFIYRTVTGFSPQPWIVGRYFPLAQAEQEIDRLTNAIYAGGGALLFALLLAIAIGVRMARLVGRLGRSAEALATLEFAAEPNLPSRLRELDDAGAALGRAHKALRWFGLYVPQRLVRRLMAEGEEALASKRRVVTIMFTDIVGFTPQAEALDEVRSAELLNAHFELLGAIIDAEHGIIDKYIGDAVMAVWGAIQRMPDHADRACRAALAIAAAIAADNRSRRERGLPPIRLRIGLHSGQVTVGNIGAPGRVNYTVVGDSVNVAQRLEQLGKPHMQADDETIVLASAETLAYLQDPASAGAAPQFVGEQEVRGREAPVGVYRLR